MTRRIVADEDGCLYLELSLAGGYHLVSDLEPNYSILFFYLESPGLDCPGFGEMDSSRGGFEGSGGY